MKYGSVCSGIEAATVAWEPLGWTPAFFSEIEAFPRAVLQHHYSHVPLHGDFTTIEPGQYELIDLLVGGTPCQSFSRSGNLRGMDDDRGNLALAFVRLAAQLQSRWLLWENVPGVLSSTRGRDFGTLLGALAKVGYGFAYRILDAQYFGVAQRRRRLYLVGYRGDWRPAAAALFEPGILSGDITPRKAPKEEITGPIGQRINRSRTELDGHGAYIPDAKGVRRLTPRECERLMGFPDDYTHIPYRNQLAKDVPRYKAIGNSMPVPVMHWIGRRIDLVNEIVTHE